MVSLWGNRRIPAGLLVIGIGILYAVVFKLETGTIASGIGLAWPQLHQPTLENILTGFLILSLPQLPLSLSNSVIATGQTVKDLFPERRVSIRRIGFTYGVINLFVPFFSGIPVCHGCGGLAGHYAFGARTGGSVILYGSMYVVLGLAFSRVVAQVVQIFPQPILGVVLLFEALTLLLFIRDQAGSTRQLMIALIVALLAFTVPQGYVVGLLVGTSLYYLSDRLGVAPEASAQASTSSGDD
jgi:MFS superfamily sulfate permease-like transporter